MTPAAPGVSATTSWRPLHEVRRVWTRYVGSDDPRVGAANLVAMVLAWNTPFYPLYLRGTAGAGMWPGGWLMLCVFPAFLAVPALTRRWPTGGRVLLVTIGTANTLFCTWLLGEASGTPLFLLPCVTLAALLFRPEERVALFGLLAMPILLGGPLNGRYPVSPFGCSGTACASLVWLNGFSVSVLLAFLGVLATGLVSDARAKEPPTRRTERPPP